MRWLKPTTWLAWVLQRWASQRFGVLMCWALAGVLCWHGLWRWFDAWAWQHLDWPDVLIQIAVWLVYALQFVWPVVVWACGVWGLWRRFRAKRVFKKLKFQPQNGFDEVSWQDFEVLVAELFRRQGFEVTLMGGDQPDGGIDVIVKRDGGTYLVQCKHWKTQRVGVKVVRELYGVVAAEGMDGGYVITSGHFTPDAHAFAKGIAMKLINGRQLSQIIEEENQF